MYTIYEQIHTGNIFCVEGVRFVPLACCFKCIMKTAGSLENYTKITDSSMSYLRKTTRERKSHSSTVHILLSSYENKT